MAYAEVGSGATAATPPSSPTTAAAGIGTQLAAWMQEQRPRAGPARSSGMPVPQGSTGDRLLESLGYHVRWTSWVLAAARGHERSRSGHCPRGTSSARPTEDEHEACWTVQEDAFLEWSVRERDTFEEWQASDHAAAPASSRGTCGWSPTRRVRWSRWRWSSSTTECGYIARLATRKDQRGRGLAQALLVDAFAVAAEHGATRSELSTDSRTGALGLYEKVGMQVTSVWVNRAIETGTAR